MPFENQAEMDVAEPPVGWRITTRPFSYNDLQGGLGWEWGNIRMADPAIQTIGEFETKWRAFLGWIEEHGLTFAPTNNIALRGQGVHVWYAFLIRPLNIAEERAANIQRYMDGYDLDGEQIERGQLQAGERVLMCQQCNHMGLPVRTFPDEVEGLICLDCVRKCRQALPDGTRCNVEYAVPRFRGCAEHFPRANCTGCNQFNEIRVMLQVRAEFYCANCQFYICEYCNLYVGPDVELVDNAAAELRICPACVIIFRDIPNPRAERFDEEDGETVAADLLIENHPHRPVRFASIEMEISEGGRPIIQELNRLGLTMYDNVAEYHHGQARAGADSFCYMERDGSLGETGGELIFPKMVMDKQETVDNLHAAIKVVRDAVKRGDAVMDLRCGLHIHVDAHKFGVGHTRNLALVFNYLEDPLYRMSSARYMRHRGFNYARKLEKMGLEDPQQFGMHFLGNNGHAHALNVQNYWASMRNRCVCGAAIIGRHDKCECDLGKCTFEFRIYNGTANFRKVHAYTALSMAMVGFARGNEDLETRHFPALDYDDTREVDNELKDSWYERLMWMFRNLYFAPNERKSMMYVINNCTLNELGEERLAALEAIPYAVLRAGEQPLDMTALREVQNARDPFGDAELYDEDDEYFD